METLLVPITAPTRVIVHQQQPFQSLVPASGILDRSLEVHSDLVVCECSVLHGAAGSQLAAPYQQVNLHHVADDYEFWEDARFTIIKYEGKHGWEVRVQL